MNEHYAPYIIGSYALTAAVLLWNAVTPRLRRNQVRKLLSERELDAEFEQVGESTDGSSGS